MSQTLNAYRVPPQMEFKAAAELRQAGIRAYVPRDHGSPRKTPIARGYVFSAYKPAFAKHVAGRVGVVAKGELSRLYLARTRRQSEAFVPFKLGQCVLIGEVPAIVASITGESCTVAVTMLGKTHAKTIHYTQLRPG